MACTCRLGKKSGKMTRIKKSVKATGLPSQDELTNGHALVGKFLTKKAKTTAKRKGRGRKRTLEGRFIAQGGK